MDFDVSCTVIMNSAFEYTISHLESILEVYEWRIKDENSFVCIVSHIFFFLCALLFPKLKLNYYRKGVSTKRRWYKTSTAVKCQNY